MEDDDAPDPFTHEDLLDYLETHSPRVLFVGYGETVIGPTQENMTWCLKAAHEDDQRIAELWNTMQAKPEYHDQVTFIWKITGDRRAWQRAEAVARHHDKNIGGRGKYMGIAAIGPDTPASGEMANVPARDAEPDRCDDRATAGGLPSYRSARFASAPPLPILSK